MRMALVSTMLLAIAFPAGCLFPAAPAPKALPLETRSDGAVRLTTPPGSASDQNPAFAPDGSRLVFTRFENGYNEGPAGLFVLDLDNGQIACLTPKDTRRSVPCATWTG